MISNINIITLRIDFKFRNVGYLSLCSLTDWLPSVLKILAHSVNIYIGDRNLCVCVFKDTEFKSRKFQGAKLLLR